MKEKHKNSKKDKHSNRSKSSSSSSSESDEWVEKEKVSLATSERENWMSMTGMLKTFSKDDIKPKQEKRKNHIDSYNPSSSSRELNPYWKDGGTGLPQTSEQLKKSQTFVKPSDSDDDYYSRSSGSKHRTRSPKRSSDRSSDRYRHEDRKHDKRKEETSSRSDNTNYKSKSYNWKRGPETNKIRDYDKEIDSTNQPKAESSIPKKEKIIKESKYLSDEKMNKLAAKLVKAEIMGDDKVAADLKAKLEAAREYRKQNPDAGEDDNEEQVMLISTNIAGSSRPLTKGEGGDPRSKGGKRKADTHDAGQRNKYFGNDDKYNLAQMFQQEKYGNNYEDEAQLARIAAKAKNPNDDLEDIFVDEISKNRNAAKDTDIEKQRAINQHEKIERTLDGCEYCVDSKNMLKHLIVTMGNKIYLAVPSKQSLVKGHCIITTIQHATCVTALDEDVWAEILNFRKALTQFFNSQHQDVVFFETATRLHRYPHFVINCVPLPRDVGDMASIYFKKALLECEAEWSMNKKVVDLKGKNIRRGVPKGLPYFWVDFGMDPGFAHVIEDQHLFPKMFAEEIIGGMLDLPHHLWKNPKKEYGELQRKKVLDFIKEWKPFEEMVKQ